MSGSLTSAASRIKPAALRLIEDALRHSLFREGRAIGRAMPGAAGRLICVPFFYLRTLTPLYRLLPFDFSRHQAFRLKSDLVEFFPIFS